jgi:tRNA(adenine34) deaminase
MIDQDIWNMQIAYEEAIKAFHEKEVPVGACLVDENGDVIAQSCNNREREKNSVGHAEILCIQEACQKLDSWRLTNTTLYVTLEPCIMCMGAIYQSRISRVVFGAYDPKGGALSLNYNFHRDKRLNHNFSVTGGVLHYQCSQILSKFFREMRQK